MSKKLNSIAIQLLILIEYSKWKPGYFWGYRKLTQDLAYLRFQAFDLKLRIEDRIKNIYNIKSYFVPFDSLFDSGVGSCTIVERSQPEKETSID